MNPPPIDGGDRHLQRRVIPADGRRPPKQEAHHVAVSLTSHAPTPATRTHAGSTARRVTRHIARLAMVAAVALPVGAGLVAVQPATADAATSCIYISGAKFDPAGPDAQST